jgi:hypothetical protein
MPHLHFLPAEKFCRPALIRDYRASYHDSSERFAPEFAFILRRARFIYICAEICILIIVLRELVGALIERVSAATRRRRSQRRHRARAYREGY